jgi:hypothetical protein
MQKTHMQGGAGNEEGEMGCIIFEQPKKFLKIFEKSILHLEIIYYVSGALSIERR